MIKLSKTDPRFLGALLESMIRECGNAPVRNPIEVMEFPDYKVTVERTSSPRKETTMTEQINSKPKGNQMTNPYNANKIRNAEIELKDVRERIDSLKGFLDPSHPLSGEIQHRIQKLEEKAKWLKLDLMELGVKS